MVERQGEVAERSPQQQEEGHQQQRPSDEQPQGDEGRQVVTDAPAEGDMGELEKAPEGLRRGQPPKAEGLR